jgi:hypothetical protein
VREGKPWFLWLHYMDPHGSYEPPEEHRVFDGSVPEVVDPSSVSGTAAHKPRFALYNVPEDALLEGGKVDVARVRDRYDGEVHYVDAEIGRLIDALRRSGGLDSTVVVVTADHGESLGEHAYWFEHGVYAYETTCRVPLIVRVPKAAVSGTREGVVSLVDVARLVREQVAVGEGPGFAGERRSGTVFCEKIGAGRGGVVRSGGGSVGGVGSFGGGAGEGAARRVEEGVGGVRGEGEGAGGDRGVVGA